MRHATRPGIPGVYIEGNYRGHKASPGSYSVSLKKGDQESSTDFKIKPNPNYPTDIPTYQEYHKLMNTLSETFNEMLMAAIAESHRHGFRPQPFLFQAQFLCNLQQEAAGQYLDVLGPFA